ncbi:IucA/IucC family protein [Streptacidiphilus monticola]
MNSLRRAEAAFAAELQRARPELTDRWLHELPGARAAVLGRLWRSLIVEQLPVDRARIAGPARRAYDTGRDEPGLALRVDGRPQTHPAAVLEALGMPGSATLRAEVEHSVVSLALSRAAAVPAGTGDLLSAERSVVDGHPYHPGCRSRPGFSVAEQLAYAPEFGQQVSSRCSRCRPGRASWSVTGRQLCAAATRSCCRSIRGSSSTCPACRACPPRRRGWRRRR